jgi:hypothetical protein
MQPRVDNVEGRRTWTINGRFVTQRVTGVQCYAYEIVRALNDLLAQDPHVAARLALRLALPHAVESEPELSDITICRTGSGSGHAWDSTCFAAVASEISVRCSHEITSCAFMMRTSLFSRKAILASLVLPIEA